MRGLGGPKKVKKAQKPMSFTEKVYFCAMLLKKLHRLTNKWSVALALLVALYSCASIGRLEGGDIDEDPPVFLGGTPQPGALHYKKDRISILFDEFVKLEKPNEKIVISPPQVQQPEVKSTGKKVVVTLKDTLKSQTTYTIDFGDAIQDNNEGNPLENFIYTFSTGDRLDTMEVSGTVLNAADLEPVKGMLVGLHANLADSAFTTLPFDRVGRTDSRGRFSIRGIAPGSYRLYGLNDADQNYFYSQPSELLAFRDSLVIPHSEPRIRRDTLWIDSLTVDTIYDVAYTHYLPDDLLLRSFKEKVLTQRLAKSERLTPEKFSLYFTAPADTLPLLRGLNFDEKDALEVEALTGRNDTLLYWVKDTLLHRQDTLRISLQYLYTDSLKQLVPRTDTLNLVAKTTWAKLEKQRQEEAEKKAKEREKELKKKRRDGDTLALAEAEKPEPVKYLDVEVYAPGTLDIYDCVTLTFKEPLAAAHTDSTIHVRHKVDSLWTDIPHYLTRDSIDRKVFNIAADWEPDQSYEVTVDSLAFEGIFGLQSDKIKKEFKVKKLEEYGQIFFNVTGVDGPCFVQLLDGSDKVLRTVPLNEGKADFYFLNPGKYGARLVKDSNRNGEWDTGSYADKRQPEEVYYYWQVLELKANFDLTQDWDVTDRPLDRQKPNELKKQKPDEDKKKNNQSSAGRRR